MLTIKVPMQPKQVKLYEFVEASGPTWIGFGGSRGGAKSHAARAVMILRRLKYPKTRGCIFRRTYEKVRENHIEPLFLQYPFMREWYNKQDKELNLPNGSVIAFRYAENPGDVNSFIGKEYMDFIVDQAEMMTEKELIILKSCTRWPGMPESQCKFVLTFNPGNIGHAFLNRIFCKREYHEKENEADYTFIQAYGWDNVEWVKTSLVLDGFTEKDYYAWDDERRYKYFISRSQYGRELDALPQAMRIGWLLGRMDQFAGQYFDCFDRERHVGRSPLQDWFPRWMGIDWGHAHDAACYWNAQGKEKTHCYREYCKPDRSPRALAQELVEATPESERPLIKHIFLSHDAFAERTSIQTIALEMGEVFQANDMPMPTKEAKDPVGGAALLYDMLKNNELEIDPSCHKLIETIPMITRDEDNLEKTVKFEGDDSYDAERIALKNYFQSEFMEPFEVRVRTRIEPIADITQKMLHLDKVMAEEKKRGPQMIRLRRPSRWAISV